MAGNTVENAEERRNYRRISDAVALHIEIIDKESAANQASIELVELPDHPTHVISLSPNGLKCYHTEAFNEGDKVSLSIKLFPDGARLDILATVVNAGEEKARGKTDHFFAGLAFSNLNEEKRDIILQHIDQVARRSFGGAVKLVNK